MLLKDFWEEGHNNCSISINGEKVDTEKYNILKLFKPNTDKKAVQDFLDLLNKMPQITEKKIKEEIKRITLNGLIDTPNRDFQKPQISLINENEKSLFGIKVGETRKIDAYSIIRYRLRNQVNYNKSSMFQSFEEIGVALYFDELDIVEEIVITSPFSGTTTKGLRIGDNMEKAIQYHGEPKIRSLVSAFWRSFSVFIKDETIVTIKLR